MTGAAAVPLVTALVLALLPAALRQGRLRAVLRIAGPALALLLAMRLGIDGFGSAGPLLTPWLGSASVLVIAVADTLALAAATAIREPARPGVAGRLRDFAVQAAPGTVALAALAGDPATLTAAAIATLLLLGLAAAAEDRRRRLAARDRLLVGSACLAIALAGAILVERTPGIGTPGLADIAAAPLLQRAGNVLMLLGFAGIGLITPLLREHGGMADEGAASGLVTLALIVPLRLQGGAGSLPAGALALVGLVTLLLAAAALWAGPAALRNPTIRAESSRGRAAERARKLTMAGLAGAALVGFGLGSDTGRVAGLLLLAAIPLAGAACRLAALSGHGLARLADASLRLLPPFGPFAAAILLLAEAALRAPACALPLGLGLAGVALQPSRPHHPAPPARNSPAAGKLPAARVWTVLALLALSVGIGLALPAGVAGWLAGAGSATRVAGPAR